MVTSERYRLLPQVAENKSNTKDDVDARVKSYLFKIYNERHTASEEDIKTHGILKANEEWALSVAEFHDIEVDTKKIEETAKRIKVHPIK